MSRLIANRRTIAEKRTGGSAVDRTVLEGYVKTDSGFVYLPDVIAKDSSILVLLGPSIGFPSIRDYAGLYNDGELTVGGGSLDARSMRGMLTSRARKVGGYTHKPSLLLYGELCVRVLIYVTADFTLSTAIDLLDFSNGGDSEAETSIFNLNLFDDNIDSFSESGPGVDCRGVWFLPFFPRAGLTLLCELRRTAGIVDTMWLNGLPLRWIPATTNGTADNDTGENTRVAPTGGSANLLAYDGVGDEPEVDVVFAGVSYDLSVHTAAEFAAGKAAFSDRQLADFNFGDAAVKAAIPGAVSVFSAEYSGITDATGNVTTWTSNTVGGQKLIGDDTVAKHWALGGAAKVTNDALRIRGDLTINAVLMPGGSGKSVLTQVGTPGESLATNFLYYVTIQTGTNTLQFQHEFSASATNQDVFWALPDWQANEIKELRIVREEVGGGLCKVRAYLRDWGSDTWVQLIVSSTDGTGTSTNEATIASTNTAGSGSATIFDIPATTIKWRQLDFFNAAINPAG